MRPTSHHMMCCFFFLFFFRAHVLYPVAFVKKSKLTSNNVVRRRYRRKRTSNILEHRQENFECRFKTDLEPNRSVQSLPQEVKRRPTSVKSGHCHASSAAQPPGTASRARSSAGSSAAKCARRPAGAAETPTLHRQFLFVYRRKYSPANVTTRGLR